MKKQKYFMIFYNDIALLHAIANKQTLFFAEIIARMDSDNVVQLTQYVRKQIVDAIGSKSKNKLNVAKAYLHQLVECGLIKDIGGGAYMVIPKIAGFTNLDNAINSKMDRWLKIEYVGKKRMLSVGESCDPQPNS